MLEPVLNSPVVDKFGYRATSSQTKAPRPRQRTSWLDIFSEYPVARCVSAEQSRKNAIMFDELLFDVWKLGSNVILAWTPDDSGVKLLVTKHIEVATSIGACFDPLERDERAAYMDSLFSIDKRVDQDDFDEIAAHLSVKPATLKLPFIPGEELDLGLMSAVVRRYGISHVEDRAVLLFDMVGFSLRSPLEQVAQLNSLSCSVNSAYAKLLEHGVDINFARTTTGDGFYIWNRARGINANIALYHLMVLILADNAIERAASVSSTLVPELKTGMHVGSHYEFYQPEGLNPTTFSYIVGDVTIELSRMVEFAHPNQILVGDFRTLMHDYDEDNGAEIINSIEFINRTQQSLGQLTGLRIASNEIDTIQCYLTGNKIDDGNYDVSEYTLVDKHDMSHKVFNAKLNLHLKNATSVFLGLQSQTVRALSKTTRREPC
jgi:hypothetical protein